MELGLAGLENLDVVCNGFEGFISQGIRDAYGASSTTTVVCTQGQRRLQGSLEFDKPVLITVTTTFPDFRSAPRQFGFTDFLEQLIVSDRAQTELPQYIQQAVGNNSDIDGVHVTLVYSKNNPVLIVAFGGDSPTASPSNAGNSNTPAPASSSPRVSNPRYHLMPLLLCSAVWAIGGMGVF